MKKLNWYKLSTIALMCTGAVLAVVLITVSLISIAFTLSAAPIFN